MMAVEVARDSVEISHIMDSFRNLLDSNRVSLLVQATGGRDRIDHHDLQGLASTNHFNDYLGKPSESCTGYLWMSLKRELDGEIAVDTRAISPCEILPTSINSFDSDQVCQPAFLGLDPRDYIILGYIVEPRKSHTKSLPLS